MLVYFKPVHACIFSKKQKIQFTAYNHLCEVMNHKWFPGGFQVQTGAPPHPLERKDLSPSWTNTSTRYYFQFLVQTDFRHFLCNYGKCNHYGKCNLWQVWLMSSVTYGKSIMSSVIMAKILWQIKLSRVDQCPRILVKNLPFRTIIYLAIGLYLPEL